jgi:PKHD-type hydroxylase
MYLPIVSLLNFSELSQIENLLINGDFKSGKLTASGAAREVKNNEQLSLTDDKAAAINAILGQALTNSPLFREGTQIKNILPFLISRYTPGMEYGWHVDSPLMSGGYSTIRVDLSITIFLSDPAAYEGGELEIETEAGPQLFKMNKGDAIIYPTTRLHRVRPVTSGLRQVAVSWIQSYIKDTAQRDLLFQLKQLQSALEQQQMGSQLHLLSQQIHSNLLRMLTEV